MSLLTLLNENNSMTLCMLLSCVVSMFSSEKWDPLIMPVL